MLNELPASDKAPAGIARSRRAVVACLFAAPWLRALAQSPAPAAFPNRALRVLVGVPPGGSTDALARLVADYLRDALGQSAVVDNRPGANTAVAAEAVARAAPDGHTLLFATEALLTVPLLTKVSFDPLTDLIPVATVALNRFVMAVHPDVPAKSLQEFIRLAKQRPGQLNYASSGSGGASHLGIEKFKRLTGTHIVHIPYRGAGPALTDAVAGQVQLSMWTPLAIAPHVAAGRLRALAITGTKRLPIPSMANVPTFAEAGLPDFDHRAWQALYAPAATPRPIVERLHEEIRKMLTSPKVLDTLERQGVDPFLSALDQIPGHLRAEQAEIPRLVKAANIKMD